MRRRRAARWLAPLLVLAATGVAGAFSGTLAGAARSGAGGPGGSSTGGPPLAPLESTGSPAVAHPDAPPIDCARLSARFFVLYGGDPAPPPAILPSMEGLCRLGLDESGLGLISEAPASASRTSVGISLPDGTGAGRAIQGFALSLALSGIPCSVDQAAVLTVDLVPPYGGLTASDDPDWSLWAPVWDLVSGGSCDPRCQNATALYTLAGSGRQFCEEDVLAEGIGSGNASVGAFAPGDDLDFTVVAPPGGSTGLELYLNDSTHPVDSLAWTYGPASTVVTGAVLRPLASTSSADPADWVPGPPLSAIAYLCPERLSDLSCESYDGAQLASTPLPEVLSALSWNASSLAYATPYPEVGAFSTSGACEGARSAYSCLGFAAYGGDGVYPSWGLTAAAEGPALALGATSGSFLDPLDGLGQYSAAGESGPTQVAAGVVTAAASKVHSNLSLVAEVAAFGAVASVGVTGYSCFASATAPSVETLPLTEEAGPTNGSARGNYSGALSFSVATTAEVYLSIAASTGPGEVGPSYAFSAPYSGGGSSCSFPDPQAPWFGPANVTAIGGGYRLDFAENSSAITDYGLTITPALGGSSIERNLSSTGPVNVEFGADGESYDLTLVADDAAGLTSPAAGPVDGGPTDAPLALALSGPDALAYYPEGATVPVNASASGGVGPYTIDVAFGDGGSTALATPTGDLNATHAYANLSGVALVTAEVTDADGETANATPFGISVGAGPLGLDQELGAGEYDVGLNWTAGGPGPVTDYTVFSTENASEAPYLTTAWPSNDSAAGIEIWNTTNLYWDAASLESGTSVYAEVVGWTNGSVGLTPDGWFGVPGVTTAPFNATTIVATPSGGPAPLTVNLSSTLTTGTNDSIALAIYSYALPTSQGSVAATVAGNDSLFWLNATLTLNVSGSYTIALHAADPFGDFAIPVTQLVVGPALPPSVALAVASGPAIVGEPVLFQSTVSGGTGVGFAYAWSFGDGGTGTGPQPNYTYAAAGRFTVGLAVTDLGDNVTAEGLLNLTVAALPSVTIRVTATDGTGTSYNFTAEGSGGLGPLTYAWSFGDGGTATGASVVHHYGAPGLYRVNVTATDPTRRTATDHVSVVVPSTTSESGVGTLTPLEEAGYLVLALAAGLAALGLAYVYGQRRPEEPEEGPSEEEGGPGAPELPEGVDDGPRAIEEEPGRVRALPPPDPPDPS